jgi:L-iditol 2-dehydrogenase
MGNPSLSSKSERMLAALLVAPTQIEVREVPRPFCPEDGLRLRVAACGICGSDIRAFRGHKQIHGAHTLAGEALPGFIVGHEIVGVIDSIGPKVTGFRPGELITVAPSITCGTCDACRRGQSVVCRSYSALGWQMPGGFAEYVAVPGRLLADGSIGRVPEGVPAWKASLAEPLACAVHGQTALRIGAEDSLLIVGGGPMGSLNVLLAIQRGATFVALADPNECRRDLAGKLGAHFVVDPKAPDAFARLLEATGGKGFSAVILAVSSIAPIRQIFTLSPEGWYDLLAPGARVNVFSGLDPGDTSFPLDARALFYQGISIVGTVNSTPRHNAEALDLIATGAVEVDSLVTARVPLSRVREGFALAMARPRVHQKVVVEPVPLR